MNMTINGNTLSVVNINVIQGETVFKLVDPVTLEEAQLELDTATVTQIKNACDAQMALDATYDAHIDALLVNPTN